MFASGALVMRHICMVAVMAALFSCNVSNVSARTRQEVLTEIQNAKSGVEAAFNAWQTKYNITFVNGSAEHDRRLSNFNNTIQFCDSYNSNHTDVWVGLGPFSHLNQSEFSAQGHGYVKRVSTSRRRLQQAAAVCRPAQYQRVDPVPADWDWAQQPNVLVPVQNQGSCGNCWAFSSTGAAESLNAIVSQKPVVSLSVQAVTSCTPDSTGCNNCATCGGNPMEGFSYIQKNGGLATASNYPFVGTTNSAPSPSLDTDACNTVLEDEFNATVGGYCVIPNNNAAALRSAVAYQPVSVAVAASSQTWQHYAGGVITDAAECGTDVDHAVLAVAYNTTASTPYWTLKNQWGVTWGEVGYVQLAMSTTGAPEGVCAVLSDPSIPLAATAPVSPWPPSSRPTPPGVQPLPPPPLPPPSGGAALAQWRLWGYVAVMMLAVVSMQLLQAL